MVLSLTSANEFPDVAKSNRKPSIQDCADKGVLKIGTKQSGGKHGKMERWTRLSRSQDVDRGTG